MFKLLEIRIYTLNFSFNNLELLYLFVTAIIS